MSESALSPQFSAQPTLPGPIWLILIDPVFLANAAISTVMSSGRTVATPLERRGSESEETPAAKTPIPKAAKRRRSFPF